MEVTDYISILGNQALAVFAGAIVNLDANGMALAFENAHKCFDTPIVIS